MSSGVLLTADWHLRPKDRLWKNYPEIFGDGLFALKQVFKVAVQSSVSAVFVLGDVFDVPRIDSTAADILIKSLNLFKSAGIQVYFVQGQPSHDMSTPPLMSTLHDWPVHIHGRTIKISGRTFFGLDYQPHDKVREVVQNVPLLTDVLCTHQVWQDFMGVDRGHALLADTSGRAGLVATGDFHQTIVDLQMVQYGRPVISPGPPSFQGFGEDNQKFVVWLSDDLQEAKQLPLAGRLFLQAEVFTEDDLSRFEQTFPSHVHHQLREDFDLDDAIRRNVIRIKYNVDLDDVLARLRSAVGSDVTLMPVPVMVQATKQFADTAAADDLSQVRPEDLIRQTYGGDPAAQVAIDVLRTAPSEFDELFQSYVDEHFRNRNVYEPTGVE